jgi:hypothetical protein
LKSDIVVRVGFLILMVTLHDCNWELRRRLVIAFLFIFFLFLCMILVSIFMLFLIILLFVIIFLVPMLLVRMIFRQSSPDPFPQWLVYALIVLAEVALAQAQGEIAVVDIVEGRSGVAHSLWCARRIRGDVGEHQECTSCRGIRHRHMGNIVAILVFEDIPCTFSSSALVNGNNNAHDGDTGFTVLGVLDGLVLETAMSGSPY